MNIKVDLKKLFAAAVSAIMCLSAGGCYLLPDEEEVLDAPTVKASDVTYSTVTAKKKDLEKKIVATGTVTAENQYTLSYEKQSGTVSKFYVKAGDKVKKGDVICDLDTYDLDYQKEDSSLKSPIDGVVSSLSDVRAGDNVNPGQTIATVIDTSALYIAIQPDDLTQYDIDTEVQIRIGEDYYDGVVFMTPKKLADYQAEQKEDHNNVDDTGIDYQADTIYVRFKDTAPAEAVGQLADTILVLDSVKDAIVISNNLIKKVDGTKVVYVLKNGEKTAVEVETGLSTGSQTEIKSGLKEGDEIVIR